MIRFARVAFKRFLIDQSGATAIEYAMIAAGIGATIASAVYSLGSEVKTNLYDKLAQVMANL
jgi:pilus assembly protein Flp/PilA